jgi:hypothetical protein
MIQAFKSLDEAEHFLETEGTKIAGQSFNYCLSLPTLSLMQFLLIISVPLYRGSTEKVIYVNFIVPTSFKIIL